MRLISLVSSAVSLMAFLLFLMASFLYAERGLIFGAALLFFFCMIALLFASLPLKDLDLRSIYRPKFPRLKFAPRNYVWLVTKIT